MNLEAQRLEGILYQMLDLLEEAICLIPEGITKERAKSYWYPHIKTALVKEHEYLGGSMFTMQDSVNELEGEEE